MCPDIIETKLLNQREREWKPDPQVINKWTVLYNLQKDYMDRIMPQIEATKNYDDIIHQKIIKEKSEKQNLANLIQFQNKVNSDLSKSNQSQFDSDKERCDDEDLKYKHNQIVGAKKPQLTDFNKLLVKEVKNNKNLHDISNNMLDPNNKSILQESMKNFFSNKNGFKFKETEKESPGATPETKFVNGDIINLNLNDEAVKSNIDFKKMVSEINLGNGEKIEYLGTSVGSPYSSLNKSEVREKLQTLNVEVGPKEIKKVNFYNKMKKGKALLHDKVEVQSFAQKSEKVKVINSPKKEDLHNKFETKSEPILDKNSEPMEEENKRIRNPPMVSSFLETGESLKFNQNLFTSLISKSNFNLETQRRGRRRSRFPDPQWDCAEAQIAKLVRYLCEEELSASYQKYCKPIFEQINTMIESYLYHDNNLEICQNLHMCPVTVDI